MSENVIRITLEVYINIYTYCVCVCVCVIFVVVRNTKPNYNRIVFVRLRIHYYHQLQGLGL